jgi:hypothetical protein
MKAQCLINYQMSGTHVFNQTVQFCPILSEEIQRTGNFSQLQRGHQYGKFRTSRQTTDTFVNHNKVISRNKLTFETPIFIHTLNRLFPGNRT